MDPRLRHLRSFVAVAEELHFGRAAQRLGIAQPAVSRHVRALEDELGAPLLVRTSRSVALTPAGHAALVHARELLGAGEELGRAVARAAAGAGGSLTVGFAESTIAGFMAPLVEALAAAHPRVELHAIQQRVSEALPGLRRGTLDAMVTRATADGPSLGDDVVAERLGDEEVLVALPARHRLAGRERLAVEELRGEPLVVLRPVGLASPAAAPAAPDGRAAGTAASPPAAPGAAPPIARHTTSIAAALALVAAGSGIFPRVPRTVARPLAGVVYVPLDGRRSGVVLLRRAEPPGPAVAGLVAVARERFGSAGGPAEPPPEAATPPGLR